MPLYWQSICSIILFFIFSGSLLSSWNLMFNKLFIEGLHFSLFFILFISSLFSTEKWKVKFKLCNIIGIISLLFMYFSQTYFPKPFWMFFFCCSLSSIFQNRRLNQLLLFCSMKYLSDILLIAGFGILTTKKELISLTITVLFLTADRFFEHKKVFKFYRFAIITCFLVLCISSFVYFPQKNLNKNILIDESHKSAVSTDIKYNKDIYKSFSFGHNIFYRTLKEMNYNVSICRNEISEKKLKNIKTLIILYPTKKFSNIEISSIKKFVKNGGSLFAVGDHSNIDGCMETLNPLIKNFGITLNFDTVWLKKNERKDLCYAYSPIFNNIKKVFLSVGASLKISKNAYPLLTTYIDSWADKGDIKNKNGFLGNNLIDPLENTKDIVLIAESDYGNGKVIVTGDSAYFQNGAIQNNYKFIYSLFNYLSSTPLIKYINIIQIISFILSFYFMFFFLRFYGIEKILVNIPPVLLTIIIINIYSYPEFKNYKILKPAALIDFSHNCKRSMYYFSHNSGKEYYDSLPTELIRNKIHPYISTESINNIDLSNYNFICIQNPLADLSKKELKKINNYLINGGNLLIIDGIYNREKQSSLAEYFNYKIVQSPLGVYKPLKKDNVPVQVPYGSYILKCNDKQLMKNVKILKALFPAEIKGGNEIARAMNKFPVISYIKNGKGKIFIISDTDFFSNGATILDGKIKDVDKLNFLWNLSDKLINKGY